MNTEDFRDGVALVSVLFFMASWTALILLPNLPTARTLGAVLVVQMSLWAGLLLDLRSIQEYVTWFFGYPETAVETRSLTSRIKTGNEC